MQSGFRKEPLHFGGGGSTSSRGCPLEQVFLPGRASDESGNPPGIPSRLMPQARSPHSTVTSSSVSTGNPSQCGPHNPATRPRRSPWACWSAETECRSPMACAPIRHLLSQVSQSMGCADCSRTGPPAGPGIAPGLQGAAQSGACLYALHSGGESQPSRSPLSTELSPRALENAHMRATSSSMVPAGPTNPGTGSAPPHRRVPDGPEHVVQ